MIDSNTVKNAPASEVRVGNVIYADIYDNSPAKIVDISVRGSHNIYYDFTLSTGETRTYRQDRYVIILTTPEPAPAPRTDNTMSDIINLQDATDRDRYSDPDNETRDLSDTPKRLLAHITANILVAEVPGDVDRLKRYRNDAQVVADKHNAIGRRAMVTGGDPFEAFKIAARAEHLIEWADKVIADTALLTAQPEPEPEPEPAPILLLDGVCGAHLPQAFALTFGADIGLNEWRIDTLQDGVSNPDYFEVWHDYLDHEPLVVIDGVPHTVYMEDGDLFAVKL